MATMARSFDQIGTLPGITKTRRARTQASSRMQANKEANQEASQDANHNAPALPTHAAVQDPSRSVITPLMTHRTRPMITIVTRPPCASHIMTCSQANAITSNTRQTST